MRLPIRIAWRTRWRLFGGWIGNPAESTRVVVDGVGVGIGVGLLRDVSSSSSSNKWLRSKSSSSSSSSSLITRTNRRLRVVTFCGSFTSMEETAENTSSSSPSPLQTTKSLDQLPRRSKSGNECNMEEEPCDCGGCLAEEDVVFQFGTEYMMGG